jgi:hypothetical protein
MATLVISTPWYKKNPKTGLSTGKPGQGQSWEDYFKTHIGLEYILYEDEYQKLKKDIDKGCGKLVMLRNDKQKRRAEASLTRLKKTAVKAGPRHSLWRYDVYFGEPTEVLPYVYLPSEELKHNGVKVIITANDC